MKTRLKGASDAPRTTPEERAKLRALAEAVLMPGGNPDIIGRWWDAGVLASYPIGQAADREFIVAASPDIVRDLLDDLRSAEDERDEIARRRRTLARFLAWLLAPLAARYEATRRALTEADS